MASVDGAKNKWSSNTEWDRVTDGYDRFEEESDEDNLQDAWESTVTSTGNSGYTSGVEQFLESEGGVDDADVENDFNWQSRTLSGGSNWASDAQSSDAQSKFENRTDEDMADMWFDNYASSYGDN